MKVVFTGLSGNLGSWLLHLFHEGGHDVRSLTLENDDEDVDLLVHTAARLPHADTAAQIDSNIIYLRHVIDYAQRNQVKRFIFISTFSVYDTDAAQSASQGVISENTPLCARDVYTSTKLIGEKLVQESGLNGFILRIPAILELNNTTNFITSIFDRLYRGEDIHIVNGSRPFRHFLSPDDLYHFLVSGPRPDAMEIMNFSSGTETSLLSIIELLKDQLKSKSKISNVENDNPIITIDISKAHRTYGFRPQDLEQTLRNWVSLRRKVRSNGLV